MPILHLNNTESENAGSLLLPNPEIQIYPSFISALLLQGQFNCLVMGLILYEFIHPSTGHKNNTVQPNAGKYPTFFR